MKKLLFFLPLAAIMTFGLTACDDDDEPANNSSSSGSSTGLGFALTTNMVEVADLTEDYLVIVDNVSYTVDIEVAYADKDELQALTVNIVNLPTGATANPASSTFNYSSGATQTIEISNGDFTQPFVFSATSGDPNPHFISATLNGVESSNGVARLSAAADLTAVVFEYEVSPSDTKVFVGSTEVESGDEVDFSDKVNGVTFTLTCDDVSAEETIKVETAGIGSLSRVWGHYVKPTNTTDDWFGTVVPAAGWERNLAMDDNYIYMSKSKAGDDKGCYVISIDDPTKVDSLSTSGIKTGGVHDTSCVRVIDNNGSSVILLCNLQNATTMPLYVYAYTSVDADPTVALEYTPTTSYRFGDKFTVEGDWNSGRLLFYDYTGSGAVAIFDISDGKINSTPTIITLDKTKNATGNIGALYRYSDVEYMWSGAGNYASVYSVSGTTFTQEVVLNGDLGFSHPMQGINFFTFNNKNYMTFVRLLNNYNDGALRIIELNYDTLAESIEKNNVTSVAYDAGLGDPDEMGLTIGSNANATGDAAVRVINGTTYIAAVSTAHGVSLFKLSEE